MVHQVLGFHLGIGRDHAHAYARDHCCLIERPFDKLSGHLRQIAAGNFWTNADERLMCWLALP
jgi:hypothetical protein